MTSDNPAKVAFLILTDSPERGIPGLVMASRLKMNRGADVRVLFSAPGCGWPAAERPTSSSRISSIQGLSRQPVPAK